MKRQVVTFAAVIVLCMGLASAAQGVCGPAPGWRFGPVSPMLHSPLAQRTAADSTVPNRENDHSGAIVGLWFVTFNAEGQLFDQGFDQWHSDGTEILNDNAPPEPANGTGSVCLGVFKKTGSRTYKLRHPFWSFDSNGNLVGRGELTETITVDPSGSSYQGSFTFDIRDLSGNLIDEVKGDLTAERITPD